MRGRLYTAPSHSYVPVKVSPIPVDGADQMRQRKISSSSRSSPWSTPTSAHIVPGSPASSPGSSVTRLTSSPLNVQVPLHREQNDELPTPPSTPCKGSTKPADPLLYMPLRRLSTAAHPHGKDDLPDVPEAAPSVSRDHAAKLVADLEGELAEIVGIQNRLAATESVNIASVKSALQTLDHVQTILATLSEFSSRVEGK